MQDAKVLLLDIETAPIVVYSWGLKVDGWLSHDNLVDEWFILCASWKWLGEKRVDSVDFLGAPGKRGVPDLGVLKRLHDVLSSADAVIAQNGDRFDLPKIRARMVGAGLPPLRPLTQIDTLKMARSKFAFTSNRLDALGAFLGVGRKIETTFGLWKRCLAREKAAVAEMVRYNKEDVRLLERVYLKLRPHVVSKVNLALGDIDDRTCPSCGAMDLIARGFAYSRVSASKRFVCGKCGAWSSRPCGSRVVR